LNQDHNKTPLSFKIHSNTFHLLHPDLPSSLFPPKVSDVLEVLCHFRDKHHEIKRRTVYQQQSQQFLPVVTFWTCLNEKKRQFNLCELAVISSVTTPLYTQMAVNVAVFLGTHSKLN
jgi:hypothetical protein